MKWKIGLIGRILIAIGLAVGLGLLLPTIHEGLATNFTRLFATFNMIFGGFLNFVVPLIIIGFIAPGIAKLGKGSGKLLGLATVFAYLSTIFAGILAFSRQRSSCRTLSIVQVLLSLKRQGRLLRLRSLSWKWSQSWESCPLLF